MKCLALAIFVFAGALIAESANAHSPGGARPSAPQALPVPHSPSVPPSVPGLGAVDSAVRDAREFGDVKARVRAKNPDATDEQVEAGTKKVLSERRRREREAEDATSNNGKIRINRSEAKQRARKAYQDNREAAGQKGITDDELKKRIKAAILKKYEIEDDPAPPIPSDTVTSASEPPVVSASVDPPETPKRKTFSREELEAIVARHRKALEEENRKKFAALQEEKRKQAAAEAYNSSRAYDRALDSWIEHHSQTLPNGKPGLASDWNAMLIRKYAEDTGGVDLKQIWEDQERAKFTGETLIFRETPPPAKVPFQPQNDRFSENDPRPEKPANYVSK